MILFSSLATCCKLLPFFLLTKRSSISYRAFPIWCLFFMTWKFSDTYFIPIKKHLTWSIMNFSFLRSFCGHDLLFAGYCWPQNIKWSKKKSWLLSLQLHQLKDSYYSEDKSPKTGSRNLEIFLWKPFDIQMKS